MVFPNPRKVAANYRIHAWVLIIAASLLLLGHSAIQVFNVVNQLEAPVVVSIKDGAAKVKMSEQPFWGVLPPMIFRKTAKALSSQGIIAKSLLYNNTTFSKISDQPLIRPFSNFQVLQLSDLSPTFSTPFQSCVHVGFTLERDGPKVGNVFLADVHLYYPKVMPPSNTPVNNATLAALESMTYNYEYYLPGWHHEHLSFDFRAPYADTVWSVDNINSSHVWDQRFKDETQSGSAWYKDNLWLGLTQGVAITKSIRPTSAPSYWGLPWTSVAPTLLEMVTASFGTQSIEYVKTIQRKTGDKDNCTVLQLRVCVKDSDVVMMSTSSIISQLGVVGSAVGGSVALISTIFYAIFIRRVPPSEDEGIASELVPYGLQQKSQKSLGQDEALLSSSFHGA